MTNLTAGPLTVTPYRFTTTAGLDAIRDELVKPAHKPKPANFVGGWGGIDDDAAVLNEWGGTPTAGNPELRQAVREAPDMVLGRFYWFSYSEPRALELGLTSSNPDAHRLLGADFAISMSSEPGHLTVLITSRNDVELIGALLPAIESIISAVDPASVRVPDVNDLVLEGSDFFLWLLYKEGARNQLTGRLALDSIRVIDSEDFDQRSTSLSAGVSTERYELLTLISKVQPEFGPVKVKIHDSKFPASYDFELFSTGQFAITIGETHLPNLVLRADKGYAAFLDVGFYIVPELIAAYDNDPDWDGVARAQFIQDCRDRLVGPKVSLQLAASNLAAMRDFFVATLGFDAPLVTSGTMHVACTDVDLIVDLVEKTGPVTVGDTTLILDITEAAEAETLLRAGPWTVVPTPSPVRSVDFVVVGPDGYRFRIRSLSGD